MGFGLLVALGLSACVAVPTGPGYGPAYEPGVSVGVSFYQPTYPNMVLVPGYPVYYYPYGNANYFFYGGTYWLYQGDRWYSSNWYNGPWAVSGPNYVPYYLLQVPVRYYRAPPPYFRGWRPDEPPHWGEHWGHDWEQRHPGWSKRARTMPPPAPLPKYQAAYSGNNYPHDREQQETIRNQNHEYESHGGVTQPTPQPYGRPPYSQQQGQPHQAPAAPDWQARQQGQPPVQYQPPHEQGNWQQQASQGSASQSPKPQEPPRDDHSNSWQAHRSPSTPQAQSQPMPGNRQPTQDTAAQTQPHQEQHRESPQPAAGEPPHPTRKHPQTTSPSDKSSAPANEGQAKKSQPAPDEGGDRDDNRR